MGNWRNENWQGRTEVAREERSSIDSLSATNPTRTGTKLKQGVHDWKSTTVYRWIFVRLTSVTLRPLCKCTVTDQPRSCSYRQAHWLVPTLLKYFMTGVSSYYVPLRQASRRIKYLYDRRLVVLSTFTTGVSSYYVPLRQASRRITYLYDRRLVVLRTFTTGVSSY
jgi:hypothetical protein